MEQVLELVRVQGPGAGSGTVHKRPGVAGSDTMRIRWSGDMISPSMVIKACESKLILKYGGESNRGESCMVAVAVIMWHALAQGLGGQFQGDRIYLSASERADLAHRSSRSPEPPGGHASLWEVALAWRGPGTGRMGLVPAWSGLEARAGTRPAPGRTWNRPGARLVAAWLA